VPDPYEAPAQRLFDSARYRQVLGHFPTGVTVVTAMEAGDPTGLAVGSFTSVSLEPPLVAFLPARGSKSWPRIESAGRFCVNILADDQEHVARIFATSGTDKFRGLGWRASSNGAPLLQDVLAWIDCDIEQVHEAGDHFIVLGHVTDLGVERERVGPLVFFRGGYGNFEA
jgi:3-hydroxy-9,10-secoandrosta-1,3,5(10)-triene-9,17-dione monooxygenase reductase component